MLLNHLLPKQIPIQSQSFERRVGLLHTFCKVFYKFTAFVIAKYVAVDCSVQNSMPQRYPPIGQFVNIVAGKLK